MKTSKIFILIAFILISYSGFTQKTSSKISLRDSTDHAIDMSDFLLNKKGFLLVPSIITEPAVGYGAFAAAVGSSLAPPGARTIHHPRRHVPSGIGARG